MLFVFLLLLLIYPPWRKVYTFSNPLDEDPDTVATLTAKLYDIATDDFKPTIWTLEDLHKIINRIRKIQNQAETREPPKDHEWKGDSISKWSEAQFNLSGLRVGITDSNWESVIATKDLPQGQTVFKVSDHHTITRRNSYRILTKCLGGKIKPIILLGQSDWEDGFYITLRIISEYFDPASPHAPFMQSLPNITELTHPYLYSADDAMLLRGSEAFESIVKSQTEVASMYAIAYNLMLRHTDACKSIYLTPQTMTFDVFSWAVVIARTRSVVDPSGHLVLMPYITMVRHGLDEPYLELKVEGSVDDRIYSVRTKQDVKKGDELQFLQKSESLHHSFAHMDIIAENVFMELTLQLFPFDSNYAVANERLSNWGLEARRTILVHSVGNPLPLSNMFYQIASVMATGNTTKETDQKLWEKTWNFLAQQIQRRSYQYDKHSEELANQLAGRLIATSQISTKSNNTKDRALRYLMEERMLFRVLYDLAKRIAREDAFSYKYVQIKAKKGDGLEDETDDDDDSSEETADGDAYGYVGLQEDSDSGLIQEAVTADNYPSGLRQPPQSKDFYDRWKAERYKG